MNDTTPKPPIIPHVHKLSEPIKVSESAPEITDLRFDRKPVAGDIRGIRLRDMDVADNLYTVIGRLVGHPPSVMQKMSLQDFMECGEFVLSFFPTGPRTGSAAAD